MVDLSKPLRVLRPDDLLVLDLTFVNLRVSNDGARAERIDTASPARIIVGFPPQHVAESAFFDFEASVQAAGPPPVAALAAGPSRLAFELADGQESLAFADLLHWGGLRPRLAPNALPPDAAPGGPAGAAPPAIPPADVTAIEFPYRLILSPDASAGWSHRDDPFTVAGRTEIWHTRLTRDAPVAVRGVARRDIVDSFRTSLTTADLDDVVTLSGDFTIGPNLQGEPFVPKPLEADLLLLSALGGSARLHGRWAFPAGATPQPARAGFVAPTLEQYEHLAGLGRDAYVRVVRRGWVSTGHRASLVKVTERRFEPSQLRTEETPAGPVGIFGATAYLRQWFQVVIQEPEKDYSALSAGYDSGGREMPLRTIRLLTLVTPKLDLGLDKIESAASQTYAAAHPGEPVDEIELGTLIQAGIEQQTLHKPFWMQAGGADVSFAAAATDWEGERLTFSLPLVFVPEAVVDQAHDVLECFADGDPARRERPFESQSMALADPTGGAARSTRAPVESITFALQQISAEGLAALRPGYLPSWLPCVASASAHLEPLERLLGTRSATQITLDPAYLANGLHAETNPAGVFAAFAEAPVAPSTDRGGGVARPNMSVTRMASRQGALPDAFANPAVAPDLASLFKDAKILGSISLASVLRALGPLDAAAFGYADLSDDQLQGLLDDDATRIDVPVLRSKPLLKDGVPYATQTRYVWKPTLQTASPLVFDGGSSLVLDARLLTPVDGSPATTEVHGELRKFSIELAEVVRLGIDRLSFAALPGRKADVSAQGFDIGFECALQFVNALENVLPSDGFADPPAIAVTPEGISAGYTLGIPTVGVGIFSIQNLALSAALSIPFTEQPAGLRFGISERHHPFIVTVTLFGGGGFFGLGVSAHGLEEIEAAIEFGGNVSLNLGVASGGVYVMAGIYFGMTSQTVTLTGYLRCGGYLSVLGLISLSLEFYLAFTYQDKGGGRSEIYGQATLTVCVKVVCFSKSIDLTVEKRFAGSGGDPTFDEVVDQGAWQEYCLAFAA